MTRPARRLPLLLGGALALALLAALSMVLGAFERLLTLWERAQSAGTLSAAAFLAILLAFAGLTVWLLIYLLRPGPSARREISENAVRDRLSAHASAGLDVEAALSELDELERRRATGQVHVAFFGQASAGKSALIQALAPGSSIDSSPVAGTTDSINHYSWPSPGGDLVQLTDVPGLLNDPEHTEMALAEARRAHLVVFVCASDLTRAEWQALEQLQALGRPLVLALNKADQFSSDTLESLREHIAQRFTRTQRPQVVAVSAGGSESVLVRDEDGQEHNEIRPRPAELSALTKALDRCVGRDPAALTALRDGSVFTLAAQRLDEAEHGHRQRQAEQIVARHTRAAIIGALAAISPGSDLVIQGAIATRLVRSLCALYEVRARDVDTDALLEAAGSRARHSSALALAVAGNALKAFPGLGTISGGLAHAVAYGLLFDALGNALQVTLAEHGRLAPEATLEALDRLLDAPLAERARQIATLALRERR